MKQDQDLFPHTGFPVRLEYQDGKEHKICWFQCQNHLDKHLTRYKIKAKDATIHYLDSQLAVPLPIVNKDEPVETPKKRGRKPKQQLFSSLDQFFETNETSVAPVGTSIGREGTQKDDVADRVAIVRTIIFATYLITNAFIVAGVIRHWNDEPAQIIIEGVIDEQSRNRANFL